MRQKNRTKPILFFCLVAFLVIPNFLIQFFLLVYLLVHGTAWLYSFITQRCIRITRNFNIIRLYRGETVDVRLTIENRSIFTIHNLLAKDHHEDLSVRGSASTVATLGPRQKKILSYTLVPDRRGRYTLGPVDISAADPFSLYPWSRAVALPARLIVYPCVYTLVLPEGHGLPGGSIATTNPIYEDITSYRSLREYSVGDDLKRINWKVSAKFGKLFTMQYQPSMSYTAIILLNLIEEDYPLRFRHATIEYAIQIAASLVCHCTGNKQETGLASHTMKNGAVTGMNFPTGKSPAHAVGILEELACVASVPEKRDVMALLFDGARTVPFGSRIFYVGPPLADEKLARLHALKRRGISCEFYMPTSTPKFKRRLADLKFPYHHADELRKSDAAS